MVLAYFKIDLFLLILFSIAHKGWYTYVPAGTVGIITEKRNKYYVIIYSGNRTQKAINRNTYLVWYDIKHFLHNGILHFRQTVLVLVCTLRASFSG